MSFFDEGDAISLDDARRRLGMKPRLGENVDLSDFDVDQLDSYIDELEAAVDEMASHRGALVACVCFLAGVIVGLLGR